MISSEIRVKVRELRASGLSYSLICEKLGVQIPKSTLSGICKGVILPEWFQEQQKDEARRRLVLLRERAKIANILKQRERLLAIEKRAYDAANSLDPIDINKIHLAMLYKGEGAKHSSYRGLALGNSDPTVLGMYMRLLELCYQKTSDDFRARVHHRADQDGQQLNQYWSEMLGVPPEHFYPPYADKRTTGRPTMREEYRGVCTLSCAGADIQLELDAIARLYAQKLRGVSSFG